MRIRRFGAVVFLLIIVLAVTTQLSGCGGHGNNSPTAPTAPSVPTALLATAVSGTQINLSWSASTGASGYKVYRDNSATAFKAIVTTSTSDAGLLPATQYCYAVSAYDGAGNESSKSPPVCATTQSLSNISDTISPSVPTWLLASAVSSTQVSLSWAASTDDSGVVSGYKIYREGSAMALKSMETTSMSDTGLLAATRYCYSVSAYDAAGNESSMSSLACATTLSILDAQDISAPSVPTGLSAAAASGTQISLSWSASTDDSGSVAGYKVYRDNSASALKLVTSASTSDTGLLPATRYCYTVSAYDAAGNESSKSTPLCATTQSLPEPRDTTAPSVPTGLSATAVSGTQISLLWAASTDDSGAIAGYKVYRDNSTAALKLIATISMSDTGLLPATQYCYTVSAYDAAGNESSKSTPVCATTQSLPEPMDIAAPSVPTRLSATAVSGTQINLSWSASTDDSGAVAGYKVYRDGSPTALKLIATTSTSDTGLLPATQHCYSVSAYDATGNESLKSSPVCATTQTTTGSDTAP